MTYQEIGAHIKAQEITLKEIMFTYTESDDKLIGAILDGTYDLLLREGFSTFEIELLMTDMIETVNMTAVRSRFVN